MAEEWEYQAKPGRGAWRYDQADFTYDEDEDDDGNDVKYDYLGEATSWTYQDK